MRKNFGPKSFLYPMPVLIIATYNENGTANAMNAAWGCIADTDKIAIYIESSHKTMKNILSRKAFTVNVADTDHVVSADYVGVVSGNDDVNKFEKSGFSAVKSEFVDAPLIKELPMALECKLISYDIETELMIGEIVNVCADEKILNEKGKIDPFKLRPITYDPINHDYISLGEKVGNAFEDGLKLKK